MTAPYETLTAERAQRVDQVRELRAQGLLQREIAERLGISRGSVSDLETDPYREKAIARREKYAGACIDCGAATDGSGGFASVTNRCAPCAATFNRNNKYWTRERVIVAIQQFAEKHGRPPTADEWIRSGPDHPARSLVYRSTGRSTAPFARWTEAIQAAGFDVPDRAGVRRTKKEVLVNNGPYLVLEEVADSDGSLWKVVAKTNAKSHVGALNAALNGGGTEAHLGERRFLCVPPSASTPRRVRGVERVVYEFVANGDGSA